MSRNNKIRPSIQGQQKQKDPKVLHQQQNHEGQSSALGMNLKNQLQKIQQNQAAQQLYTCRICLQQGPALHANTEQQLKTMLSTLQQQKSLKQPKYLITACKCQGTSGYIHQRCMIQWIDAQYKRSKQKQMKCEICLQQILYQRKTIPYFQFQAKNICEVPPCHNVCVVLILMIIGVFVALEILSGQLSLNQLSRTTIFVLLGLMVVALGIALAVLIKQAFYKKRKETVKVFTNDEVDICGIKKDVISHYDRKSSIHQTQNIIRSIRTIRSARSIRDIQRQGRFQSQYQIPHDQVRHTQRLQSRNQPVQQRENTRPPRSARVIRTDQQPTNVRSIYVRSRQNIEEE